MPTTIAPIVAATQDHLEIEDIKDDVVVLKDGGVCLILQTTAVNFGLLSEKEQDNMIYSYAGLLNSLSFPIQIVIRSKKMDISFYLDQLLQQEMKQPNEALKNQIHKYREFVRSLIRENNVLDKKFYVIIPFYATELGIKTSSVSLLGKRGLPLPEDYILEQAKNNLFPKKEHIIKQFSRIGLKTKQLTTPELIELFYYIYNTSNAGSIKLPKNTETYTAPIVQPAIEGQTEKVIKTPIIQPISNGGAETEPKESNKNSSIYQQSLQQKLASNKGVETKNPNDSA